MYKRISWIVYVSVFLEMTVNSSTWSSGPWQKATERNVSIELMEGSVC